MFIVHFDTQEQTTRHVPKTPPVQTPHVHSLQHHARLAIFKNDVDYSHLPQSVYLSLGLPKVEVLERMGGLKSCVTISKNDGDHSHVPSKAYLSFGWPKVGLLEELSYTYFNKPDDGLTISAELGCVTSMNFFRSMGAIDIGSAMMRAVSHGHIDVLKEWKEVFAKCCVEDFEDAATNASVHGYIDIIKLFKEWDVVDDFQNVMDAAANEGHIDIVKLCKDWGCDDLEWCYENAAANGHYDIVELLIEWDDSYVDTGMVHAAEEGHIDIVRLCKENGAEDFDHALIYAIRYGHIEIVKLFKEEWDAIDDLEKAMAEAARFGHIDMVMLCKEYGAVDYERATRAAYAGLEINDNYNQYHILKLVEGWNDPQFDWDMIMAVIRDDTDLLKEMKGRLDYRKTLKWAVRSDNIGILNLIIEWSDKEKQNDFSTDFIVDFNDIVQLAAEENSLKILYFCRTLNVDADLDKAMQNATYRAVECLMEWKLSRYVISDDPCEK